MFKAKYYKDCSHLIMSIFLEILKSKDLSLLCYSGRPNKKLLPIIWGEIEAEYEQITGKPEYYHELAETNEECKTISRINALVCLYHIMEIDDTANLDEFKAYWEVEGVGLTELKTTILREKTRYEIKKDQQLSIKKLKESNKKPLTIERLKIYIETSLNKDYIDFSKITVKEWCEMCDVVVEKNNEIKRLNDARTD